MKKSIPALLIAGLLIQGAFANTNEQKNSKKEQKSKRVARKKTKKSRNSKSKKRIRVSNRSQKTVRINPFTGKPIDLTYTVFAGYENNSFKNINISNSDAEKVQTKGYTIGLGIETKLNENISTTTTPSASFTNQNRTTYDG